MEKITTIKLDTTDLNKIAEILQPTIQEWLTDGGGMKTIRGHEFKYFGLTFMVDFDIMIEEEKDDATDDTPAWNECRIDYVDVVTLTASNGDGDELELDYSDSELNQILNKE